MRWLITKHLGGLGLLDHGLGVERHAHHVETVVHVDGRSGDTPSQRGQQKGSGDANVVVVQRLVSGIGIPEECLDPMTYAGSV